MKEYSKVIYMKFKPEEVEILHDRMKEAGVQNMSAYIRKIQKRESELIKSVSVVLRFIRSSRGLGHFPQQAKMRRVYTGALLANLKKMKGRTLFMRNLEKEQRLGRNGIENLCIKPTFNYCTGEEQFTFFKLPKCLIDDACFWGLSIDAKLLYAIFLDRVSLSIKNGWVDENGRVFIIL